MKDTNELKKFQNINSVATKGGIVFVGSDFFSSLPLTELAHAFRVDEEVHNRSARGASVADVCSNLEEFVLALCPCKVFINLGDVEASEGMATSEFIESFERLLYCLHNKCNAEIYVVSMAAKSELHNKYNIALKKLSAENGCRFIDISSALNSAKPEISFFNAIKLYVHRELNFTEIMLMR